MINKVIRFCYRKADKVLLHGITGPKARYRLDLLDDKLSVLDTLTNELIDSKKLTNKEGIVRWRIKPDSDSYRNGYRYFDQKDIDTCLIRRKIAETPIETLQKRNNVEATIFQLGYHYPNDKSRYRGLIKHQMWTNVRCFWVNFVRIVNFIQKIQLKTPSFVNMQFMQHWIMYFYGLCNIDKERYSNRYSQFQKNLCY